MWVRQQEAIQRSTGWSQQGKLKGKSGFQGLSSAVAGRLQSSAAVSGVGLGRAAVW